MRLLAADDTIVGWGIGYTIAIVVLLVVVALVATILVLAHRIAGDATRIDDGLAAAADNTAALHDLHTTNASAAAITAGLRRGRERLGG